MNFNGRLWREYSLLVIAAIWALISYFFSISGDPDVWFARSGAVMVFSAVAVEYRLGGMLQNNISAANAVAGLGIPSAVSVPPENRYLATINHAFALVGTLIWAYGDLLW